VFFIHLPKTLNHIIPKNCKLTQAMTAETSRTLEVAQQAFEYFQHGLATGEWQQFIDMLTDDFSFWFPMGQYHGLNTGKERAIAFFAYVSQAFDRGLTLTLDRVTSNETTVVFEFRDEGLMRGQPYKNRVAVSLTCGVTKFAATENILVAMGNQTKGVRSQPAL
jgi:ketosteroid isomerase-like protein